METGPCGNIFIRPSGLLRAGQVVSGHKHNFDHTTILYTGSIRVRATLPNGGAIEREFGAVGHPNGRHFLVKAEVEHEIMALEDNTEFWCVYSHRNSQGEVVQHWDGWEDAYR